jgi:hypothetical protein
MDKGKRPTLFRPCVHQATADEDVMHHRIGNPLHDDQIGKQTRTDAANEMIESGGTRRVVADQSDSSRKIERTAVNEPKDDRQKRSRIVIGAKPIDCTSFDSSDCAQVSAAGLSSQDVRRPHTDAIPAACAACAASIVVGNSAMRRPYSTHCATFAGVSSS